MARWGDSRSAARSRLGGVGWLACVFLLAFGWSSPAAASSDYTVIVEPNVFQALPIGGGTVVPVNTSDGFETPFSFNLPFPVSFFGQQFTSLRMSPDGWVSFNMSQDSGWAARPIPDRTVDSMNPFNLIAVWWWDVNCPAGAMKSQTIGTPGQRTLVLEWANCPSWNGGARAHFQLWLFEGSPAIEMHYNTIETGPWATSIGIQNHNGSIGYSPVSCNGSCTAAAFPVGKKVSYVQSADLAVTRVSADPVMYTGVSIDMEATVANRGGKPAPGGTVRFWLSRDALLSQDDVDLGWAPEVHDLAQGGSARYTRTAIVPEDLEVGRYYILAQAVIGPGGEEATLGNNVGAFGPVEIGAPTPDLAASAVVLAESKVAVDGVVDVEWELHNLGNLEAFDVPYLVVLSENDFVSTTDRILHRGLVSIDKGSTSTVVDSVLIPEEIRTGAYHVGIILDPDALVDELNEGNNTAISDIELLVFSPGVEIVTPSQLGVEAIAGVSVELQAWGGDGFFEWSVESGSLPPGLSLHVERDQKGRPLYTLIAGSPETRGRHSFGLRVRSSDWTAVGNFTLDVGAPGGLLKVTSITLDTSSHGSEYEGRLLATGGIPPYVWSLTEGSLPQGLSFFGTGTISGRPQEDGTWALSVEVVDSVGARASADVELTVAPPGRLTCDTQTLLPAAVGTPMVSQRVVAAGGARPYTFETTESRRLASGSLDGGQTYPNAPPPGLSVTAAGDLSGTPEAAGRYVWTVAVKDALNNTASCAVIVDVSFDQGPAILTTALPDGLVDTPWVAQLEQFGADTETAVWSLVAGNRLPEGLTIRPDGRISGMPSLAALEGQPERVFAFVVQVRDASNKGATQPLSIRVMRDPPRGPPGPGPGNDDGGGCASAGAGVTWSAFAVAAYALMRRRADETSSDR